MNRLAIESLSLRDFRNYEAAEFSVGSLPAALHGDNGAGKTNILEAVSLLAPGRGLRRAAADDLSRSAPGAAAPRPWRVAARARGLEGPVDLALAPGADPSDGERRRRGLAIDGQAQPRTRLADHLAMLWLTPADDRLFLSSPDRRRRFLDRLALALDPGHAPRAAAYDRAMAERAKLLREPRPDPLWLDLLERRMAERGVALAAARREVARALEEARAPGPPGRFPRCGVVIEGEVDQWIDEGPAAQAEDRLMLALAASRGRDAERGGAGAGPHRSDLTAFDRESGENAARCSTGRQKALLISVIIALVGASAKRLGATPILLLDEIAAHLDARRRGELFDALLAADCQFWLTGTEASLFDGLDGAAARFTIENGTVIDHGR